MHETCPLIKDCDAATSRDSCAHFTDKAGKNWCRYFQFSPVKDPVKTGQIVEIDIEDADDRGNGIGRVSGGFVVRVDGGIPGKSVKAEIQTVYDNSATADLIEFTGDVDLDSDEDGDDGEDKGDSRSNWYGK